MTIPTSTTCWETGFERDDRIADAICSKRKPSRETNCHWRFEFEAGLSYLCKILLVGFGASIRRTLLTAERGMA